MCDRLYFDELTFERVMDILELENPHGVIVSTGGQIPNNLALRLDAQRVPILGTSARSIDNAEDRDKFSAMLDRIGVDQPEWRALTSLEDINAFVDKVGFPVLVRPSYVLSGAAMNVCSNREELERFLQLAANVSKKHPVVVSQFIEHAKEVEMDAVAQNGEIVAYAISEHIEFAGVHSGDATIQFPPQKLYVETVRRIKRISREIARELNISGPFNIQYLAKDNDIKVIECNLRASRSFPFVSKVLKINFIELATKVMLGIPVQKPDKNLFDLDYVGINFSVLLQPPAKGRPRIGRGYGVYGRGGVYRQRYFLRYSQSDAFGGLPYSAEEYPAFHRYAEAEGGHAFRSRMLQKKGISCLLPAVRASSLPRTGWRIPASTGRASPTCTRRRSKCCTEKR